MDSRIAQRFQPFLASRETIRWTGAPRQGFALRSHDLFLIPLSVLWTGFAVFWEYSVWMQSSENSFMVLWGAMFVCIGVYLVVGRFVVDAYARTKHAYALTDTRALILSGLNGEKLVSIDLLANTQVRYDAGANTRGTILFGADPGMLHPGIWHPSVHGLAEFFQAKDAAAAYKLIQVRKRALAPSSSAAGALDL